MTRMTIYTKDVHVETVRLLDDGKTSLYQLIDGIRAIKKSAKKGKFKDLRLSFDKERNWNSSDVFTIKVTGSRPENTLEKERREKEKYNAVKWCEHQLAEAKKAYSAEQKRRLKS